MVSQRPHPFATARGQRSDGRVRALRFSVLVLFFRVITISFTFFCQILGLFAQSHREQGVCKRSRSSNWIFGNSFFAFFSSLSSFEERNNFCLLFLIHMTREDDEE